MEVSKEEPAMLCNYEVYQFLQDVEAGKGQLKPNKHQGSLGTILYETVKYLETTPCKTQDAESIQAFLQAVKPYKLTKAEKLQLVNQCPTTPVEIMLIVEESEERLTEEQIQELLDLVNQHFPVSSSESKEIVEEEEMEALPNPELSPAGRKF